MSLFPTLRAAIDQIQGELKLSANAYYDIFQNENIQSIPDVISLSRNDFVNIGGNEHDYALFKRLANNDKKKLIREWTEQDVQCWIDSKPNLKSILNLSEAFQAKGITGEHLLRLTKNDLRLHFGLDLRALVLNGLFKEICALRKQAYEEQTEIRNKSVTFPQISLPNDKLELNEQRTIVTVEMDTKEVASMKVSPNLSEMHCDKSSTQSFTPVVSFIGRTGSGKSFIINELLPFNDRLQQRGPIIAATGSIESTTGNIQVYSGIININAKESVDLEILDVEGASGGLPNTVSESFLSRLSFVSKEIFTKEWLISLISPEDTVQVERKKKVERCIEKRTEVTSKQFPQLVYLLSNVIVLVSNLKIHDQSYIEEIKLLVEKVSRLDVGNKPGLIIVCSQSSMDFTYDYDACQVEFSQRLGQEYTLLLSKYFLKHTFLRLPHAGKEPELYDEQIQTLKREIQSSALTSIKTSPFFTSRLWYEALPFLTKEFEKRTQSIDVPGLIFKLCKPADAIMSKVHKILEIIYKYSHPPPVREYHWDATQIQEFDIKRNDSFNACLVQVLQKFAEIIVEESLKQKANITSLENPIASKLIDSNFGELMSMVMPLAPCEYRTEFGEICLLKRGDHTHSMQNHKVSAPISALVRRRVRTIRIHNVWVEWAQAVDAIMTPVSTHEIIQSGAEQQEKLKQLFLGLVSNVFNLDNSKRFELQQEWVMSLQVGSNIPRNEYDALKFCLLCLANYSDDKESQSLLCGHHFCSTCTNQLQICPICTKPIILIPNQAKGITPRLLSLDGRGGAYAIFQLLVLEEIEERTNFKIHELFDFIAATSTSAVIAVFISMYHADLSMVKSSYKNIIEKSFHSSLFFNEPYYDITTLEKNIQDMINLNHSNHSVVDSIGSLPIFLVPVVAELGNDKKTYMFGNYDPKIGKTTSQGDRDDHIFDCWATPSDVLTASFAVGESRIGQPFNFKGYELSDGAKEISNPADKLIEESGVIFDKKPEILVSISNGKTVRVKDSIYYSRMRSKNTACKKNKKIESYRFEGDIPCEESHLGFGSKFWYTNYREMDDCWTKSWNKVKERLKHQFDGCCGALVYKMLVPNIIFDKNKCTVSVSTRTENFRERILSSPLFKEKEFIMYCSIEKEKKKIKCAEPMIWEGNHYTASFELTPGTYTLIVSLNNGGVPFQIAGSPCEFVVHGESGTIV